MSLTPKQMDLLRYIGEHIRLRGATPTPEQMRVAMGLKAKSGISRLVAGLEERRRICRGRRQPFTLEILVPWTARSEPEIVADATPDYDTAYIPFLGRARPREARGRPTACFAPYPFRDHKRCSEWSEA